MPKTALSFTPGDSMSESYRVSALVSCCNSAALLGRCLDDLIGQSLYRKNQLEIIVIDSGSTQPEHLIVAEYQSRYPHIRLLRTKRETVYAAWNRGIQIARGRYITNANTDDAHRPDGLELLACALDDCAEADLAYAHCAFTNQPNDVYPGTGRYLDCKLPPFTPALGMMYCLLGPHPLWRRRVFSRIGYFDPGFSNAGDYDFQMRFIQAGLKAVVVPEILSLFYQNPKGLSLGSNATMVESRRIEARYRATTPIARLYPVEDGDGPSQADAWTAQGNLAQSWTCAWLESPPKDIGYALLCYALALQLVPQHPPAVRNVYACLASQNHWPACEDWVEKNPQDPELRKALAAKALLPLTAAKILPVANSRVYRPDLHGKKMPELRSSGHGFPAGPESGSLRQAQGKTVVHLYAAFAALQQGNPAAALREWNRSLPGVQVDDSARYAADLLGHLIVQAMPSAPDNGGRYAVSDLGSKHFGLSWGGGEPAPPGGVDEVLRRLRRLEFQALGLPAEAAPFLLAGARAAERSNWQEALKHYRIALERSAEGFAFQRPLQDKVALLQSRLGSSAPPSWAPISACPGDCRRDHRLSRLCRQDEFETPHYAGLCSALRLPPGDYERKNWEYFFIARALQEEGLLGPGRAGLGFGVGKEKLAAFFAQQGCSVLATDLEPDSAAKKAWVDTHQHSDGLGDLNHPEICDAQTLRRRVNFGYVDMNDIPRSLMQAQFDFTWSCCAFEHLGSIEKGKQFILNQMDCLRPGGVALHTTEFNLSSDVLTVSHGPTVIFRRQDIEEIAANLRAQGHEIAIDFSSGNGELDRYIDIPPYLSAPDKRHLRLLLWQYTTTSIGLFIRKKAA
jgi:hypothetical protein